MNARLCAAIVILFVSAACDDEPVSHQTSGATWSGNIVAVETSMGDFEIELFREEAPVSTENFVRYVKEGFYDGLTFHRVIDNFMIQGGMFDQNLQLKTPTYLPIQNEAGNGLLNLRGTISMARTVDPQSATTSFFINTKDNPFLDHEDDTPQGYGYAVFGRVTSGMDVVDAIGSVRTGTQNGFNDVPLTPVVIEKMTFRWFTPD
jgi:cyclophilin family peptidyl-prolyl cis-trans isomerase